MRLEGIDLNLLVVLAALLQERGVTAAARRVGLSQSATSHALSRLREQLEDPILLRTPRGMVPTARAEALLPVVQRILEDTRSVFLGDPAFDPERSEEVFRLGLDTPGVGNVTRTGGGSVVHAYPPAAAGDK